MDLMSSDSPARNGNQPRRHDSRPRQVQETFDAAATETVQRARRLLHVWLDSHHLDSLRTDILLAVGELITNAVVHGRAPIRLVMTHRPDRIRIEVRDAGGGHPAIRPIQRTGPDAGGWGLHMVDQLVDTWGTHTSHSTTTVWIEQPIIPTDLSILGPRERD